MTPQTPPTDRPLTAGEPLWMVHVLGPDEIYPAPDHATAVEWCAGLNGAIPDSDVLCVAVPALWTASSKDHAAGLKDARDDFAALARPATSAASEGEVHSSHGSVYDSLLTFIHDRDDALRGDGQTDPAEIDETVLEIMKITNALASPPVSELLREARWYVNDHQESQPNDETKDLLARIDGALK